VAVVVSQPDRPSGRGRRPTPSPVSALALARGLPLLRPERVGTPEVAEALAGFAVDLGVVVAFGQFLPRRIRELPRLGYLINAHASLLPRLRGAAPIARAILEGARETGLSVMRVEREMDAGPVALVRRTAIGADETAGALTERLAALGAEAIAEALEAIAGDRVTWTPQDPAGASFAPKLEPEEARLDFREGAEALARRIRAMAPRPGAFTTVDGERLRVLESDVEAGPADAPPGTVRVGPGGVLRIATGEGWLLPRVLQRAGGRPLATDAFLRGRPLPEGLHLPSEQNE
jgi:methionyl-tRNA formyltransferase